MDSGSRGLSCCHLNTMKTIAFAKHKPRAHWQLTLPVLAAVLEQSGDLPGCTDQLFTPSLSWLRRWGKRWLDAAGDVMGCWWWWWWWREATFFPWLVWHCGPFCTALWDFGGLQTDFWHIVNFNITKASSFVLYKLTIKANYAHYAWLWKLNAPNVQLEFQCAVPTLATCPRDHGSLHRVTRPPPAERETMEYTQPRAGPHPPCSCSPAPDWSCGPTKTVAQQPISNKWVQWLGITSWI